MMMNNHFVWTEEAGTPSVVDTHHYCNSITKEEQDSFTWARPGLTFILDTEYSPEIVLTIINRDVRFLLL